MKEGTDTTQVPALRSRPHRLVPNPARVFLDLKSHPLLSFLARPS